MRDFSTRRVVIGLAVIGVIAMGGGYALAASETITTSPSCCTYTQSTFRIDTGQVAVFHNGTSGTPHTATAATKGPDGKPLFNSGITSSGSQRAVNGTQYMAPGTYHFFCRIHGPSMSSNLVVTGNGTPVARPAVKLKVLSGMLARVASSGRLSVKASATTNSSGVTLTAFKGAKKLGAKRNVNLASGASRTIKIPLTAAGRGALRGLASAKVKVAGTVPFGSPATAKRKLH